MSYSLAIFDLDGTILHTLTDLEISLNYALTQLQFPTRTSAEVQRFIGNGMLKLIERATAPNATEEERAEVYRVFTDHYAAHCVDHTRPYDGIPALLSQLAEQGLRLAVVSNKDDYAVRELCQRYFPGAFAFAVGRREGIPKKPAPDLVNLVLQELKIPAKDAVYIGDSDVDMETARNAGMDCISVTWGYRDTDFLRAHGASVLVDTPEALLKKILA
ncbi:MAG: HAD family hydrolase [Clostridia bacterium]|nr:HAD family hydrolase [Clostridia bacterium]